MTTDSLEATRPVHPHLRYGNAAVTFHWLTVVFVVIVGILGLLHDDWPKQTQSFWINIHALLGTLLYLLLIARMAYALFTLASLRAAAALWHHFYLRDGVLRRMWPRP